MNITTVGINFTKKFSTFITIQTKHSVSFEHSTQSDLQQKDRIVAKLPDGYSLGMHTTRLPAQANDNGVGADIQTYSLP